MTRQQNALTPASAGDRPSRARPFPPAALALLAATLFGSSGLGAEAPKLPSPSLLAAHPFVVSAAFEPVLRELLADSPTVRRQFEEIEKLSNVRVYLALTIELAADRRAQTEFRPWPAGGFEARIEIGTPLRIDEYAELLAHELEHVLERVDGIKLENVARARDAGVRKLADGSFETDRAIRTGREAASEVLSRCCHDAPTN